MSGYVKILKFKDGNKDNKLISFRINDEKLLKKYKTTWTKIADLKIVKLNALPVYDDRYIKNKIKFDNDKIHTNFRGLNEAKDGVECEFFTIISIDYLLVYENRYYLQLYLDALFINAVLRFYLSKGIDLAKSNDSKECIAC